MNTNNNTQAINTTVDANSAANQSVDTPTQDIVIETLDSAPSSPTVRAQKRRVLLDYLEDRARMVEPVPKRPRTEDQATQPGEMTPYTGPVLLLKGPTSAPVTPLMTTSSLPVVEAQSSTVTEPEAPSSQPPQNQPAPRLRGFTFVPIDQLANNQPNTAARFHGAVVVTPNLFPPGTLGAAPTFRNTPPLPAFLTRGNDPWANPVPNRPPAPINLDNDNAFRLPLLPVRTPGAEYRTRSGFYSRSRE